MSAEPLALCMKGPCQAPAGKLMGSTEALVELELEVSRVVGPGVLAGQRVDGDP